MKTATAFACALLLLGNSLAGAQQPVLRYTFDEASGDALDSGAAPATDGVLIGGATRSADTPSGAGLSLDLRTDDPYAYVLGPDGDKLDGLAALTLTTWLNVEAYPTNVSNNKRLIAKQAATTFGGFNFSMNSMPNIGLVGADNFKIGLFLGNNISAGPDDFGFVFADVDVDADNKWVMLAVTYDSSLAFGNTKFYIGDTTSPMAQLGSDQTIVQLTVDAGGALFGVGYTDAASTADTSVTGAQDDVRVYNAALDLAALEAVRLENAPVVGGLAADFNGDQHVNAVDFNAWVDGFGITGTATRAQGDSDADLDVDGADFLAWQREFGMGPVASGSFVPEPAAAMLLALAAAIRACTARRRR